MTARVVGKLWSSNAVNGRPVSGVLLCDVPEGTPLILRRNRSEGRDRDGDFVILAMDLIEQPTALPCRRQPLFQRRQHMLTRQEITERVACIGQLRQQWNTQQPQDRGDTWRELRDAFADLSQLVDTDEVEPDAWAVVLRVDALASAYADWARSIGVLHDPELGFTEQVWQALALLIEEAERDEQRLETVAELYEQAVPLTQIAKMQRWYSIAEDGRRVPDVERVRDELKHPGRHAPGPDPREVERLAEVEKQWAARAIDRRGRDARYVEPIEELLKQKVPLRQIAKIHRIDVEAVRRVARAAGLTPIDDEPYRTEEQRKHARTQELGRLFLIDTHPEAGDLRDRVLAMHADGLSDADIGAALREQGHPDASHMRVRSILVEAQMDTATQASPEPEGDLA